MSDGMKAKEQNHDRCTWNTVMVITQRDIKLFVQYPVKMYCLIFTPSSFVCKMKMKMKISPTRDHCD